MLANQERMETGRAEAIHVRRGMNAAFGYFDDSGRDALGQPQRGFEIHGEGLQIAVVDTDEIGAAFESYGDFGFVMRLDERGHSVARGKFPQGADAAGV